MIADQFHPLDEVRAFGNTEHGLLRDAPFYGTRRFVDGVGWPLAGDSPQNGAYPLQLVRLPGVGDVPLTADQLESERAQGRVWQNYALLLHGWYLLGQNIGGWIYFASDGVRWVIRPASLPGPQAGQPYSVTLACSPFGYLDGAPRDPVSLLLSVGDIGQDGSGGRGIGFETISSDGARAVLRLTSGFGTTPMGYLEISISDTDGVLGATLSVLRSQATTLGTWQESMPPENWATHYEYLVIGDLSPPSTEEKFPPGGGAFTFTATHIEAQQVSAASLGAVVVGSASFIVGRSERIVSLVFDDADTLIEYTHSMQCQLDCDYPALGGVVSGSTTATETFAQEFRDANWTGSKSVAVSRTVSETLTLDVRLHENGVEIAHERAQLVETCAQAMSYSDSSGTNPILRSGSWRWGSASFAPYGATVTSPTSDLSGTIQGAFTAGGLYPLDVPSRSGVDTLRSSARINNKSLLPDSTVSLQEIGEEIVFGNRGAGTANTVSYSIERARGGVRLLRRRTRADPYQLTTTELAVRFPHVGLAGRGPVTSDLVHVYNPATRELITDLVGGIPETFI